MSKKYRVPWVLSNERLEDENYIAVDTAASEHGKQLTKAEVEISRARDFCETLRGHLVKEEAYSEVTVVEHIEKLICKARNRLSEHDTAHTNLFIAYFDLKAGGAL